jgi:hypothetical protein
MSASSLRILTLGYSVSHQSIQCRGMASDVLNRAIRTLRARASRIRCVRSLVQPSHIRCFRLEQFSSSDESGRSREAQELTWEVHELSMRRFPLRIPISDPSDRHGFALLVLLCRQKRGFIRRATHCCRKTLHMTVPWQVEKRFRSNRLDSFCPIC